MSEVRSEAAITADRLQEQIVYRSRVLQIWVLIGVLAVGIGIAEWHGVTTTYVIAGIAAWLAFSLHFSFTAILHELYEINDQIAGRKDEFRKLIQTLS